MIFLERFCEGASASHRPPGAPVQRARRSPIRPRRRRVEESARTVAVAKATDDVTDMTRRVFMENSIDKAKTSCKEKGGEGCTLPLR
jgi:hypothetical protein